MIQATQALPADIAKARYALAAGQVAEAKKLAAVATRKHRLQPALYLLLGDINLHQRQFQPAFEHFHRALSLRVSIEAYLGMARASQALGNVGVAEQCLNALLGLEANHIEAYSALVNLLLQLPGRESEAKPHLMRLIELQHRVADCYCILGNVFQFADLDRDRAQKAYLSALNVEPRLLNARVSLAVLYNGNNAPLDALRVAQEGLALGLVSAALHEQIGRAYLELGQHQECLQAYRHALTLEPDNLLLRSNFLATLNYSDCLTSAQIMSEHCRFGELCRNTLQSLQQPLSNGPIAGRRLRIGYVSADFKKHAVVYFVEPLLRKHDRETVEIFCYYNDSKYDAKTADVQGLVEHWRDVYKMSDRQLAQQIRNDGIDVLIDLSGHTPGNRLLTFAQKPAPVQVTWLGYGLTSGMTEMDYVVLDRYFAPDENILREFVEQPMSLPVYRVFQPEEGPTVNALPALTNGYVTFASYNNFIKISEDVLHLWAQILLLIPDSRLLLVLGASGLDEQVRTFFAARGIASERLLLRYRMDMNAYLASHLEVDIALDPFPFNGATTSFHGLWMGVPMITLVGPRVPSRSGISLLGPLGLDEFVAETPQQYLQCAEYWASHLPRLNQIRLELRQRLLESPLMDDTAFARSLEHACYQAYRNWSEQQAANRPAETN